MKIRKTIEKGDPKNKKIAYDFFVNEKGYSPEIALGIIGNLMQESHVNLVVDSVGFDGTGSFGIAQWLGPRKSKLKEIRPDDWDSLRGQLEFIDWELNNTEKRAGKKLKEAKSTEDATLIFSKYYERPHKDFAHNDKRIKYAQKLGEEFGINKKEVAPTLDNQPKIGPPPPNLGLPSYTGLPADVKPNIKEDKEINEEQLRKILEVERQKTEQNFLSAFKNQNQPQEQPEPRYQPQDVSHLYNYIDINNYADGGKKKSELI